MNPHSYNLWCFSFLCRSVFPSAIIFLLIKDVGDNFLRLFCLKNYFLHLKNVFVMYRVLGWQFLPFSTLKIFHCLLACIISTEKSFKNFFPHILWAILLWYPLVWFSLDVFCLVSSRFWICGFIVFNLFEKILDIISSNRLPIETSRYTYFRPFDVISHLTDALFIVFVSLFGSKSFFTPLLHQIVLLAMFSSSLIFSFAMYNLLIKIFSSLWFACSCFFACLIIFDWMQDMVNFTFLGAGHFSSIPLNILDLFSGVLLSYLETVWSF